MPHLCLIFFDSSNQFAGVGGALAEVVFRPPSELAMAYELDLPGSGQVRIHMFSWVQAMWKGHGNAAVQVQ